MSEQRQIRGHAVPLRIENLDTDQIMPKQFLKRIDKAGLAEGVLYDLRFDAQGQLRPESPLNQPAYTGAEIILGGSNFGCGSSREHAVWGLLQYGIRAVIASGFGEIFYSNAMNNRLLLVSLPPDQVAELMAEAERNDAPPIEIDLKSMQVQCAGKSYPFSLSPRHLRMFVEGLDMIGLTLQYEDSIQSFASNRWAQQPWLKDIAQRAISALDKPGAALDGTS